MIAAFTCPACGEERLVEVDQAARGWFCQVCGRSGELPSASAALLPPPDGLHALLLAVVRRHLTPGTWQVVGVAPIAQWPHSLQVEVTRTLSAGPESVVLVLERVP